MKKFIKLTFILILILAYHQLFSKSEFIKTSKDLTINNFIENKGQIVDQDGNFRNDVKFVYEKGNFKLIIRKTGWSYELSHKDIKLIPTSMVDYEGLPYFARYKPDIKNYVNRVDVEFDNPNPAAEFIKIGQSTEHFNFYNTYNPNGIEDVYSYEKIIIQDIYPGIDVEFRVNGKGIKYNFTLKPGADLNQIRMKYYGYDNLILLPEGKLRIEMLEGFIEETIPESYTIDENYQNPLQENISVNFQLNDNLLTFKTNKKILDKTLIIDPEIVWGSYYGSNNQDGINAIQRDALNNVIASGYTNSTSNIATSGTYQNTYGGGLFDAFLVKFSHSGQRLWATYFGGDSLDVAEGVAADNVWHHIYIMGYTASRHGIASDSAWQTNYGLGYFDAFLAKFDQLGHRIWSTYYGGPDAHAGIGGEYIYNAAIDERLHDVYITGVVSSRDSIASAGAHQTIFGGEFDALLAKFTPDGKRDWATYYGGDEFDGAYGITLDPSGYITIGGYTASDNSNQFLEEIIATEGAFQETKNGSSDAFLARFNLRGTRQWGTYYGGSDEEIVTGTAADKYKNIYIVGKTSSDNNIATNGAHQTTRSGSKDAFLGKFRPNGERIWGTYYGGVRYDEATAAYCDSYGFVAFVGETFSKENISTPGSFQEDFIGRDTTYTVIDPETQKSSEITELMSDGFIAYFDTTGQRVWGTYFGGWDTDRPESIAYDYNDNLLIGGYTASESLIATQGSFQPNYAGGTDAFLMKFGEFLRIIDVSTPICLGNRIDISFETGTQFNSGNIFTAQLSDSTGDFSNPLNIGTLAGTGDGVIEATLPSNIEPTTGYRIRVISSNPAKISKDNGYDITINPLPKPEIIGNNPACSREHLIYTAETDSNTTNHWFVHNGEILSDSTLDFVIISWYNVSQGNLKVIQTNNVTGCVDSVQIDVDINISPEPRIIGEEEVMAYSKEEYHSVSNAKWDYYWEVSGGNIISNNTGSVIEVEWGGPGVGMVKIINTHKTTGCIDSAVMNIAINAIPIKIYGEKSVCALSEHQYYISPEENYGYKWTAINGEVVGIDNDTICTIRWGDVSPGTIKLIRINLDTQEADTVTSNVEIIPLPVIRIFGNNETCEGNIEFYNTDTSSVLENLWAVENGTIIGDNTADTVKIQWNEIPADSDTLNIKALLTLTRLNTETGCSNSKTMNVSIGKKPEAKILGSNVVCENDISYFFTSYEDEIISNKWSVEGGNIIGDDDKDTIQVNWGSKGQGKVSLVQTGITYCAETNTYDVEIADVPPKPTITQEGIKLISSADYGNQWYANNELIQGATEKEYEPDSSGIYSVRVIVSSGCESAMSEPYNFVKVSVDDFNKSAVKVYPNPASSKIILNMPEFNSEINIILQNSIGETLRQFVIKKSKSYEMDISDLSAGLYLITIKNNEYQETFKIVKY